MIANFLKIFLICIFFFHNNITYSKTIDSTPLTKKNLSNYFSALVSLSNDQNANSLKYFNSSKFLKESNDSYLKKYLLSLVLNGKIPKAISEIKEVKKKKMINFFDAQLLLMLENIKNKDYDQASIYFKNIEKSSQTGNFEMVIASVLEEYVYLFKNKDISPNFNVDLGKLSYINKAFQYCYLGKTESDIIFREAINSSDGSYSRYLFFHLNYLISQNEFKKAEDTIKDLDPLGTTLLVDQGREWIKEKNYSKFNEIFSCKNSNDIIAEFFFLISNLYSSELNIKRSNYYFNLSQYFNPKFKFNKSLLAENYIKNENFVKAKKILNNFDKKSKIYHWYKIKKIAQIISKESNEEKSFNYINSQFKKIQNPPLQIIYDMGNFVKAYKKYELSIEYYSKILLELDPKTWLYADILYRRGSSYERMGDEKKSDQDLIKSLEIDPEVPHVLNYLAYSWLERNYKIEEAMSMLEKAYDQEPNDPYIIDSIAWAYYMQGEYVKAEKLMQRAVELMPYDPVVNDHYGDILWKLDRKIQANYFWKSVLNFKDTEEKMKTEIYQKLLKGPKKI